MMGGQSKPRRFVPVHPPTGGLEPALERIGAVQPDHHVE